MSSLWWYQASMVSSVGSLQGPGRGTDVLYYWRFWYMFWSASPWNDAVPVPMVTLECSVGNPHVHRVTFWWSWWLAAGSSTRSRATTPSVSVCSTRARWMGAGDLTNPHSGTQVLYHCIICNPICPHMDASSNILTSSHLHVTIDPGIIQCFQHYRMLFFLAYIINKT